MTTFNKLQQLKRRFFSMRNGAVADSLRRSGAPYRIIFGLNLPQLVEIAREFGPDVELAQQLRENVATRESMLIAPMLFPAELLTKDIARQWLQEATTTEVIDIACLKLIKFAPWSAELVTELAESENQLLRYAALRLGANILPTAIDEIEAIARKELERNDSATRSVCHILLDDIEWRRDELH